MNISRLSFALPQHWINESSAVPKNFDGRFTSESPISDQPTQDDFQRPRSLDFFSLAEWTCSRVSQSLAPEGPPEETYAAAI